MTKKLPKPDSAKPVETDRAFKTAWFAKEARKAKIADKELYHAIMQVMQGQAYLYAKKDRENIAPDELAAFKKLAKDYGSASDARIAALLNDEELLEICHDD